jgi:hemerythrin
MTTTNKVLDPAHIPAIAVDSMNRTHHEEVALVNRLGELVTAAREGGLDTTAIDAALNAWVTHTESHFAREDELMEKYGFPPFPVHAQEHATVLAEIHRLRSAWQAERNIEPLTEFVFQRWPQWFTQHVNSMDNITAQFLSNYID